ncbi:Toll/interleukin-1 receptor domain-containing protein, partial [Tanacetum coccineum]
MISLRVVSYVDGLPLALKVLGSFLYDKDEKEWMSTLERLKEIPESEIVEKLKISYDRLKVMEKELFLDIVCFFRGKSKDYAMEILDACGFYPDIGIMVLRQKALITINSKGEFDMHDLVQEMGYYIVRGEHPNNPEKHSRLWKIEEINNMCLGDITMENDKTEVIHSYNIIDHPLRYIKIISNMKKLRWLKVFNPCSEAPDSLSKELRYIDWTGYPVSPFPDSFQPTNLVVMKMRRSLQKEPWKGWKCLPHLKVLQLETFKELLSTPDFEGLPCLQELVLYECTKLEEIHPSLGNHKSLKHVTVSCRNLKKFPTIDNMKKLETLCIHYDIVIEITEIQSNMENLVTLSLGGSGTQDFLSSVAVHCPNLISLRVTPFCTLISIDFNVNWLRNLTHNLRKLNLYDCRFNDGEIPSKIGDLSNLQELDLSSNYFSKLDFSLSQLTQLVLLNVSDCNFLETLPELPSSIVIFAANRCDRLVDIGDFHTNCTWLCQVAVMYGFIVNVGDRLLQSMLQLPENWSNDFCRFLLCVVLTDDFKINSSPEISMEQVTGGSMVEMDSQDDVDWEESVDDKIDG